MADKDDESGKLNWKLISLVGLIIFGLWLWTLLSFLLGDMFPLIDVGERGTFGDMFGGLNALFTGAAFFGIIVTILMQRKELELQREELRHTRNTLEAQRKEMETQNETLKIQQFESTFFSLLRLYNDIVSSIDLVAKDGKVKKGRDCIKVFRKRLSKNFEPIIMYPDSSTWDNYQTNYMEWFKNHETELGYYFRNLYNIVKFVDKSDFKEKGLYLNLIRAQLSTQELVLLFHNCLNEKGKEKFKPLVEKYALLKSIPDDFLLSAFCRGHYHPSAYGEIE